MRALVIASLLFGGVQSLHADSQGTKLQTAKSVLCHCVLRHLVLRQFVWLDWLPIPVVPS